ncbi:DUF6978 family protein [Bifidobacterium callitrichos]|uniref:Prophage protein n=1 Tax=Bifidobacterium callitrichos DSM 23973 TaxID=1437609 RepID=A0A087A7D3_9BIFI|nr:hypothetical protein [Bifidobacterium callitrichos]KFI54683.1 prophage protein [Bifidobacterium callitrichos DSM 23973]
MTKRNTKQSKWSLSQQDAERLIKEIKKSVDRLVIMPAPGEQNRQFHVRSESDDEDFTIALFRGKRNPNKHSIAARITHSEVVLMRLCVEGTPHTNPGGSKIGRTHLHVYHEGVDDRVAYPIDIDSPDFVEDTVMLLDRFHVVRKPNFQEGIEGTA